MIKPDGVQRTKMGSIVKKFEQRGFKVIAMKLCQPGEAKFEQHYEEHKGKPFFSRIVKWAATGPVLAMVLEGTNVISTCRKIIGATSAPDRNMATVRGDFSNSTQNNLIHGSDSVESATREINLWFTPEELTLWESTSQAWIYE